jgi:hypothetical protein
VFGALQDGSCRHGSLKCDPKQPEVLSSMERGFYRPRLLRLLALEHFQWLTLGSDPGALLLR